MKKILSLFLITLLIFTSLPIVYATDSGNASIEDMSSISAENGLGKIIENLTEVENEDEYANSGYSISDMTFDGITANVTVNVPAECTLVVAIYDENTSELISSATKKLSASVYSEDYRKDIISLDMNMLVMPEHFLAKAFLLDENNNALCKNYTCRTYTTQFEIFMETTPADFEGKDIITMDDNCDDFGVLVDGAVTVKKSDTMTYTYDNGVYTFYNATDEVKNLKADDIFYYQLSDEIGDFLLIKVLTTDVDGTTVTITEDEEIALGDAFQFIRIDEDADFSDVELTEENLGSALSFQKPEMQASTFSGRRDIVVETSKSYSTSLNVKYPQDDSENKDELSKELEVKGSLTYTLTASVSLYYDARWGKDFYELKTDLTHNVGLDITFTGKIELNKEAFKISFPTIPLGILELDISLYPVVSAEASVKFGGSLEVYNRMSYTDANGLTKINDTKWWNPDGDLGETEVEITIGLGVDFDIGFKKGKEDEKGLSTIHVSIAASIEAGVKGTFVPSLVGNLLDKHHDCVVCLDGSLSIFVKGTATLKIKIISKSTTVNWDAIDLSASVDMGKFYFSIGSHGMKLGFGTCPYISHKVTITVYDNNGNPVKDALVSTTTGYCDADGDKKFKETSMNTDENGQAVFYFKKGNHEVVVKKDGIGTSGQKFEVLAIEKEINLVLFDAEYFNGHYYKAFDENLNWLQAKRFCEDLGGHLVTISSEKENSLVCSLIPKGWDGALIGLSDASEEGHWKWVTNEPFTFSKWDRNEPNNQGNEDYAGIGPTSYWNDGHFEREQRVFICEWETIPSNAQVKSYRIASQSISEETTNETIINGTTASRTDALIGAEYVAVAVKDEFVEDIFANDNLIYIDQKTAESSTVSFDLVIPEGVENYTVKIFGVSHTHTPDEAVAENIVDSTCSKLGSYESVTYCTVCGEELSRDKVETPTLPHNYNKTVTAPTCTAQGFTTYTCSCGDTYVSDYVNSLAHSYMKETTAPTCTEKGKTVYTCSCGETYTETIEATGHDFDGSVCVNCSYNKSENCSCNCHKTGIAGFFWKVINFFNKIFKIKQYCDCGINHY